MKTQGFAQGIHTQSSTATEQLGTIRGEDDGSVYSYAKAGAVALSVAKLTQGAVPDATYSYELVLPTTTAIGSKVLSVTFGSSTIAEDFYKDGYLWINKNAGIGHRYRILGHKAANSANSYTVDVHLETPLIVAVTASSSEATIVKHPQDGVLISVTTDITSTIAGIPPIPVTASYYFWNQVKGPAVCLTDGTIYVLGHVRASDGTGGAVEFLDRDGTHENEVCVGTVLQVNATAEYSLLNLAVPGY